MGTIYYDRDDQDQAAIQGVFPALGQELRLQQGLESLEKQPLPAEKPG